MKNTYIDRTITKLKRKYGKDELVASLNKKLKEKDTAIGQLKAEIDHLNHQLKLNHHKHEIDKQASIENKKDHQYINVLKQNKKLRKRLKTLQNDNKELISKLQYIENNKIPGTGWV